MTLIPNFKSTQGAPRDNTLLNAELDAKANTTDVVTQYDFEQAQGISSTAWAESLGLDAYATTSAVAAGFVPRITSVDNRLVRFDGTTGAAQGSGITVDDSNNFSGVAGITASGTVSVVKAGAITYANLVTALTAGVNKFTVRDDGAIECQAISSVGNSGYFIDLFNSLVVHNSSGFYKWTSTSNWYDTADLGYCRNAVGVLEINNGTAGAFRDLTLRNLTASGTVTCNAISKASGGLNITLAPGGNYLHVSNGVVTPNLFCATLTTTNSPMWIGPSAGAGNANLNLAAAGSGAVAVNPAFPFTCNNLTASGRIETTSTENASSSLDGALRVAGGMSAQMNIQSGGTIRGRDLRSWQPSGGTIGWNNGPVLFNDNGTVRLRNEADTEFRHLSLGNLTASGTVTCEGEMRYRMGSVRQAQFSLTSVTVTGTGTSASQGGIGWRQRTGTTANSTSVASWRFYSRYNNSNTAGGPIGGIAWNQPLSFSVVFTSGSSGFTSTGTHQIAFRSSTTGGALTTNGIGFERRSGSRLWLLVHNGTTSTEIDSGIDFLAVRQNTVEVRSNGAGVVTLWLNNVQIATTSSGPTTIVNASENDLRSFLTTTDSFNQDVLINHIEIQGL